MLNRERIINTITFKTADRIPLIEWPIREATMSAWLKQGFPEGVSAQSFFSLDTFYVSVPLHLGMLPQFEVKVFEQNEEYKIWQDELGAVRKDFVKDRTPGFVTRTWLKFPVETREDFQRMKRHYDSSLPDRVAANWVLQAKTLNKAVVANHLNIPFLFWTVRDWMGFENLCLAFYDMPDLLEEMFIFLTDMIIQTLDRVIEDIDIDLVQLSEDMAYKGAPMISPELFKKFMLPHYARLVLYLKIKGAKFVYVDSDGFPGGLIPLWLEAGIDGMAPCEIAAGNDLVTLRKEYPRFVLMGGIDKRELSKGKKEVEHEVMRQVPFLIEKGGYIPHVDHAVPPDVPLENYIYYRKLISKIACINYPE